MQHLELIDLESKQTNVIVLVKIPARYRLLPPSFVARGGELSRARDKFGKKKVRGVFQGRKVIEQKGNVSIAHVTMIGLSQLGYESRVE